MDAQEFRSIARDLQARWFAFEIPDMALAQYVRDLQDLDVEQVAAAVAAIAADGADRPPTAGRIRQKVAELQLGAPIWAEVKRQLIEREEMVRDHEPPEWTCPHGECDGSGFVESRQPLSVVAMSGGEVVRYDTTHDTSWDCRCRPDRIATRRLAETLHPLVREFISAKYVTWDEVATVGQGGATTLEAQMRSKWEAFISRAVESRTLAALSAPGDMKRIEDARVEDSTRHGGLRRMDPSKLLERGAA